MEMPDPTKDHPLIQDARRMLHFSQMLMIFGAIECPEKDKQLLSAISTEVIQNLSQLSESRGAK